MREASPKVSRRAVLAAPWVAVSTEAAAGQPLTHTPPPEVSRDMPEARWRGAATMRFLGLHIYDARLWSPAPVKGDGAQQVLAIELEYARGLSGPRIAQRSLDEMRKIGDVDNAQAERWLQAMVRLFPDVKAGDRITGINLPGQGAHFFANGRRLGEVAETRFADLFFGIWLSPRTSEPGLRTQLMGLDR